MGAVTDTNGPRCLRADQRLFKLTRELPHAKSRERHAELTQDLANHSSSANRKRSSKPIVNLGVWWMSKQVEHGSRDIMRSHNSTYRVRGVFVRRPVNRPTLNATSSERD